MEKHLQEYARWQAQHLPEELAAELAAIRGDESEIYDRFCRTMHFGTSGLRGRMGVGTNRINAILLGKATRAISRYLTARYEAPAMVIGYDTRHNSREYAVGIAKVFAQCGVSSCLFAEPTPVPVVSFAVRHLQLNGGIMITASHNTKEYNGYKVYDHYGNQIDDRKATLIEQYMEAEPTYPKGAEKDLTAGAKTGTISFLGEDIKEAYLAALQRETLWWTDDPAHCREALGELRVCYTPLNGCGRDYVLTALDNIGVRQILCVARQDAPNGEFPTCPSPNPEYPETFAEALRTAGGSIGGEGLMQLASAGDGGQGEQQCENHVPHQTPQTASVQGGQAAGALPDLLLATDPDSDRLGVMVLHAGRYQHLSGNEVGELLFDYVCRVHAAGIRGRKLGDGQVMMKSIVSSPLTEDIAKHYGVRIKNVFTGFKNIAAAIEQLGQSGERERFLFGFEESLGYLYGDYTRDKDGIMAAQLICLAAAEARAQGLTLVDRLQRIYETYGYLAGKSFSVYYQDEKGRGKMQRIMERLFADGLKPDGFRVKKELCYRKPPLYCAELADQARIIVRPSGTEPKLKTYIFCRGEAAQEAQAAAAEIAQRMQNKWKDEGLYE